MLPNLNEPDYDTIKRQVSISEVLSKYTSVPHQNKYRIPCIIHGGEGDNFSVDEKRGLFHCFVCEAAGDVIKLYAVLENITNGEAARRLSYEFGVRPNGNKSFHRVFNEVRAYAPKTPLPEIDLKEEMARLGLHPKPLENYRNFSKEAIAHFGLQLVETGILIPFRDGPRTLGYSIRQVGRMPKYLNNTGFRKSEYLYGLGENEQYIADAPKAVYVVEGQFDCIRMWDAGFKNVVSTLNATMSPAQANILGYWVSRITVVYDGDEKGRYGAQQIKERYGALFNIQIIDLPDGQDPDVADLKNILNNGETNDRPMGTLRIREDVVRGEIRETPRRDLASS